MELELSLGDSPAPVKATIVPPPTCMVEEGLELVLGVRAAKRAEQDNQTSCTQSEDVLEGEDDETRPCGGASVESLSFPQFVTSSETGAVAARPLSPSSMLEVSTRQAADQEAGEDVENGSGGTRKKLRLSKEQSAFLENSFREHNTLTPKQKNDLANRLNLRPRQVEVWFQNRRARTKLKQTELDCEHLKRCCERLSQENRRLQAELRALRTTYPPLYSLHLPAAGLSSSSSTVLRMCSSCASKVVVTAPSYYSPPTVAATPATITAVTSSPAAGSSPAPPAALFAGPHFGPFDAVHPAPVLLRRQPSATW